MNGLAQSLSWLEIPDAVVPIREGAVTTVAGDKFKFMRPTSRLRRNDVEIRPYKWSPEARDAFGRVAVNFLRKRANVVAVARALSIDINEVFRHRPTFEPTDEISRRVESALARSEDVRCRFATYVGGLKKQGLRDASILADPAEASTLATNVLAPVAASVDVRARQAAGPAGYAIGV